ncbi:MAG: hypothetical protein WC734_02865 [Patescibacteria group bacterium]|jgi:hypothetical protein
MNNLRKARVPLFLFLVGLALTVLLMQMPSTKQLIVNLGQSSIVGALVGGVLYAFAFTSSTATVIFLNIPKTGNTVLLAILGGLGAALYDLTIYSIVKSGSRKGVFERMSILVSKRRIPNWLSIAVGVAILGSPLPDEFAAGFFGFLRLSVKQFIGLALVSNTVGILVILLMR